MWQRRRKKENNPKNSGHYILLKRPRAGHTLRSNQFICLKDRGNNNNSVYIQTDLNKSLHNLVQYEIVFLRSKLSPIFTKRSAIIAYCFLRVFISKGKHW